GQVAQDSGDLSYNIFRWYRAGWGRYSQADPLSKTTSGRRPTPAAAETNGYRYAVANPLRYSDARGLYSCALGEFCTEVRVVGFELSPNFGPVIVRLAGF